MRQRLLYTLGVFIVCLFALTTVDVSAVTDAKGEDNAATSAWDKKLPAATRFIVLKDWKNEAVLDRETGLVWEKSPTSEEFSWGEAQEYCNSLTKGNRSGWRVPTVQELATLVDGSIPPPGPTLPSGHPFLNVTSKRAYWSANIANTDAGKAWYVGFYIPGAVTHTKKDRTDLKIWCVRGGQGVDIQ